MGAEGCGDVAIEPRHVAEIEKASPVRGEDLCGGNVDRSHILENEAREPALPGEDRRPPRGDRREATDPQRAAVFDERREDAVFDIVAHRHPERSAVATEPPGDRLINLLEGVEEKAADMVRKAPCLADRESP